MSSAFDLAVRHDWGIAPIVCSNCVDRNGGFGGYAHGGVPHADGGTIEQKVVGYSLILVFTPLTTSGLSSTPD